MYDISKKIIILTLNLGPTSKAAFPPAERYRGAVLPDLHLSLRKSLAEN